MSELTDGPIDDDELTGIIRNALAEGIGSDQDELVGTRAQAMDYYMGKLPKAPAIQGRSSAVSNDVADTVEALLAQIMPTFASDTTATFEATNEQDEQQAQLESDICNYYIMEKCSGYRQFYEAIKDALLLSNGIVKVYVDEGERLEVTQHGPLDEEQLLWIQANSPGEVFAEENDEGTVVKRVIPHKELKIESVDPNDFIIDSSQRDIDLKDCKFVAQRCILTSTQLIEMGIDPEIIVELPTYHLDHQVDQLSRNQVENEDEHRYYEPSQRPIEVWECYMRIDVDGDGIGELRKILYTDNYIVSNEIVPWIPYACGAPFINPHRWVGISVFSKIKDIADQKTIYMRQYADNMVHHNNRRLGVVESQTNLDDAINSRPGGIIRMKVQGAVQEIPVSDIGPSCINALSYLDKQRTERVGASLDMQSEGLPTGNNTAHGVERQMSFKEQLAGMITKTLAETLVKQTYLLTHKTLKRYFPGVININRNGNWQQSDPQQWGQREYVSIDVGMSQGERLRQANSLQLVMQMQMSLMQAGMAGIITDASKVFNTVMDYCRMSGLDNPSQYWIDPQSPQAAMSAQQQAMAQQAQQQALAQQQNRIISMEEFKAASDAQKDMRDYEFKVAEQMHKVEQDQEAMTKDWSSLELQYGVDIEGKGQ